MINLFYGCENFNEDVSAWDVRRAEDLGSMFCGASSFNQPLGAWNIRRAKNLSYMVASASSFDQPLGAWAFRMHPDANYNGFMMFDDATAFDRAANAPWYTAMALYS